MIRWLVLALLVAFEAPRAAAQTSFSGPLSPGAFESTLNLGPVGAALQPPPSGSASPTRFVRDPALLKAKAAQVVAALRQQSPAAAAQVETLFSQDLIAMVAPDLRRIGFDHQDMADMTAIYWIGAWEASHGIVGHQTDPAVARSVRDQIARALAGPATRMSDRDKQEVADAMFLQAVLAEARMRAAAQAGPAMRKQMSDAIHAEASGLLKTDLRAVTLTAAGFAPASGSAQAVARPAERSPASGASTAGPAPHAGNWARVEGVYFKSYATFGVGGMVISDFEPLVFFRDGTYFEVGDEALEDVDLAARRRDQPTQWGRWTKSADGFALTDHKGRSSQAKLQGGAFFKAFPAEAGGGKLAGKYSRVSGGGNSALGGEMTIAARNDLSFEADGRYMRASSAGAAGSGAMTGVATSTYSRQPASGVGRYRIERHTITLTEPDGRTRRQFFAFGSKKTPPQLAADMIFIGDRVFVVRGK